MSEKGQVISGKEALASDVAAEKKLRWKCDRYVLPSVTMMCMLAFLDRTNIGNAKIQGMTDDLHMSADGRDYSTALFIFFVPYILFEIPSNLIVKRLAPSTWLSIIMTLWGVITIIQGLVTSVAGLVACRFFLGLFEAGIFPASIYLISMYYTRFELQWRLAVLCSAGILTGAFSGLLAYAIAHMDGVRGYRAWRWIFILEGILTVIIGIATKFWITDWPEKARWLNDHERQILLAKLHREQSDVVMNRLDKRALKRIFSDWKIYCGGFIYFGIAGTFYAGSFFIPTILLQQGYKAEQAQVRTIPIYIVATIICLTSAYLSDRLRHRYTFAMAGFTVASIGYIILLCQASSAVTLGVQYFALFLVVGGVYMTQPVAVTWLANNFGGHYKRSVGAAFQVSFGNIGGIVASNIFLPAEQPRYPRGYGTSLAMLWVSGAACTVLAVGTILENRKRDRGERDYRLQEDDVDNMGDDHPSWRFTT